MKLLASTTSPFARKVLIAAHELGLQDRLEVEWVVTGVLNPHAAVRAANPLVKIPALVLEGGEVVYDSPVILEYLHSLVPSSALLPASGLERFAVLRTQALADGILDAAITVFYELVFRPKELHFADWIAAHRAKAMQGVAELERSMPTWARSADTLDAGQISVAALVGWLAFRPAALPGVAEAHPALFAWFDSLAERPSIAKTVPFVP